MIHNSLAPVAMIGDINMDVIMSVPDIPVIGHESTASHISHSIGGSMLNAALVLSGFQQKVMPVSFLGNDAWGKWILSDLKTTVKEMVFDQIQVKNGLSTGMNFIAVTPDGERTMFGYRGANVSLSINDIKECFQKNPAALYLSGYVFLSPPQQTAAIHAIEMAQDMKIPVFLDTALDPVIQQSSIFREIINKIDICVLGVDEASTLCHGDTPEDNAQILLDYGISMAAIKLKEQGCYIATRYQQMRVPAFEVKTCDTTGAGDAFTAGVIYGWLHQFSPLRLGILANALGGLASTIIGTGMNLPGKEDLIDFLKTHTFDSNSLIEKEKNNLFNLLIESEN